MDHRLSQLEDSRCTKYCHRWGNLDEQQRVTDTVGSYRDLDERSKRPEVKTVEKKENYSKEKLPTMNCSSGENVVI